MSDIGTDIPKEVDDLINESLGKDKPKKKQKKVGPSYKMVGDSKIPVSKATGSVWQNRYSLGSSNDANMQKAWTEAIKYYENDQIAHRKSTDDDTSGNTVDVQKLNDKHTETENVVFANVSTMVPALYSRNPKAEFTSHIEGKKKLATIVERLVNVLGERQAYPGINLKPKAKRCVVTTLLTNRSWLRIGWTHKKASSEQALADLQKLGKALEKAKNTKEVESIEGKIMALEQQIDVLEPSGPFTKYRSCFNIIVDPNAEEIDLSDANWMIDTDFLPTEFILAVYAKKNKGTNTYDSIYQPTHVMKVGKEKDDGVDEGDNFTIFEQSDEAGKYGYDNVDAYNKSKMTKVCYVWDKTTRRLLMYNFNDWSWPIWVWDDPLLLDTFFPYYPLTFFSSPNGVLSKGEVTYYLDQQDAINEIVSEERRSRKWAFRNVFFNKNLVKEDDAKAVLNGPDGTVRGIEIPEGMKLSDVIGSITPPGIQHKELFDKEGKYKAIDRISSTGEVLRGAQFKANTNTSAVQTNVAASNMRIDEKSDAIEDFMGRVYWGIAQLCLQYMDVDTVIGLIGEDARTVWTTMTPEEIRNTFSVTVVGGSTKKPTSAAKKEEAIQVGQTLGQFAKVSPAVVKIMLEVMQEAFDEITIKEEDWQTIIDSISQPEQGQGQPPQGQDQPTPTTGSALGPTGATPANASPEQLTQLIEQLPPEIKAQMEAAVKSGVDPVAALTEAIQLAQGQADNQPTIQ